jgi:hypothetical protein
MHHSIANIPFSLFHFLLAQQCIYVVMCATKKLDGRITSLVLESHIRPPGASLVAEASKIS